jgi:hypothetical protein
VKSPQRIRRRHLLLLFFAVLTTALAQEKPQPQFTVDLKPLGAAPDLFTDQSDTATQQRGVINTFWLGNDRIAVAFSTNHRWNGDSKPEPLHVRLLIFDATSGKQLQSREWSVSAEGPEGGTTLAFAPGPDDSILVVHESSDQSTAPSNIPEGDFIQVLNPDTSLRQDLYVPATSAWVPSITADGRLAVQTFYADKHPSLAWWSGHPLKPGPKLDIPPGTEEYLAGPGVVARADCPFAGFCTGVQIYSPNRTGWKYNTSASDTVPMPRAFLSPTALLIELRREDQKVGQWIVAHADGSKTALPPLPKQLQALRISSLDAAGGRVSLDAAGEVGICGAFGVWCKQLGESLVIDVPANRIVFQQETSAYGGVSALSPDGKHVAIFDRDRLSVYLLP